MNHSDVSENEEASQSEWKQTRELIGEQLSQTLEQLNEIGLLLEQSELEVNKLTQRNADATGTLKRVQTQFDRLPREEIRAAYDAALDAQQRLFVIRGQVEKFQSDKAHLQRQIELLELLTNVFAEESHAEKQLKSATSTVELLEMLVQAQEAERQRLSRQMHDGPAQALSNLILETEIAMRLFDLDKEKAYEELGTLRDSATKTFQQVRDYVFELRPMMLDDLGLVPTLKKYTSAIEEQSEVTIRFGVTGLERRMESYLEVMIFRAIQELIRNALLHSQANLIDVQLDVGDSFVRINVEDNGMGFDVESLDNEKGMGLKLIRERVDMTGGNFEVDSRLGEGTRVSLRVPDSILGDNDSNLAQM
jgi:two-component system sensor histidine kinase DegS